MTWKDKAKEFLKNIVEIYSPTGHEKDVASYIASYLKEELKFQNVEVDDMWNVSADVTYGKPKIYLIGHIDTVPGKLPVRCDGRKLYGRGAVDAKGPFAALVMAAFLLKNEGYSGGLKIAGLVDEEGFGKGIRAFSKRFPRPDYAIFGEPSGPNHITIGYKGRIQLSVEMETETHHASAPWIGTNAFKESLKVYEAIKKTTFSFDKSVKPGFESITSCITRFEAGDSSNVTPGHAKLTIDIRIPPYVKALRMVDSLKNAILGAGLEVSKLRMGVEETTEAYEISTRNPLVRAFRRGIYKVLRKPARLVKKTGTGDMNYYGGTLGVPSLTIGPGNPNLSHTSHEVIDLDEFIDYILVIKESLKELLL